MVFLLICFIIFILCILTINFIVRFSTYKKILKNDFSQIKEFDCILVLGAGVIDNSRPTLMLRDRIDAAIKVYKDKKAPKIIMSGDHGREDYNEVKIMKEYAIKNGNIPSQDIFMDHAGFSSYDSIYRAKEIFGAKKIIIVTQKYHLYRCLYIAKELGLDFYGINANARKYRWRFNHEVRESIARCKDFFVCKLKLKPKFLGEKISLNENGDITNDK